MKYWIKVKEWDNYEQKVVVIASEHFDDINQARARWRELDGRYNLVTNFYPGEINE